MTTSKLLHWHLGKYCITKDNIKCVELIYNVSPYKGQSKQMEVKYNCVTQDSGLRLFTESRCHAWGYLHKSIQLEMYPISFKESA